MNNRICALLAIVLVTISVCACSSRIKKLSYDSSDESFEAYATIKGITIDVDSYTRDSLLYPMLTKLLDDTIEKDKKRFESYSFTYDDNSRILTNEETGEQINIGDKSFPDIEFDDDAIMDIDSMDIHTKRGASYYSYDENEQCAKVTLTYEMEENVDEMDTDSKLVVVYRYK